MCLICIEFQRNRDLADAKRMLMMARREPSSIDPAHLDKVEQRLARLDRGEADEEEE